MHLPYAVVNKRDQVLATFEKIADAENFARDNKATCNIKDVCACGNLIDKAYMVQQGDKKWCSFRCPQCPTKPCSHPVYSWRYPAYPAYPDYPYYPTYYGAQQPVFGNVAKTYISAATAAAMSAGSITTASGYGSISSAPTLYGASGLAVSGE